MVFCCMNVQDHSCFKHIATLITQFTIVNSDHLDHTDDHENDNDNDEDDNNDNDDDDNNDNDDDSDNDHDFDDNVDDDGDNDDDELATFIDSNYMIHESYILMILFNMNQKMIFVFEHLITFIAIS